MDELSRQNNLSVIQNTYNKVDPGTKQRMEYELRRVTHKTQNDPLTFSEDIGKLGNNQVHEFMKALRNSSVPFFHAG